MKDTNAAARREIQSQIFIHTRQTKLLIWTELERGGCAQSEGQLALRSDGTGTWSCATTSGNPYPGDLWYADFAVKDRNGATLFGLGPFYSPRMCSENAETQYRWSAPFTFSADLFPLIHASVQNCGTLPPVCVLKMNAPKPMARQEVVAEEEWARNEMSIALEAYA